CRAPEGKSNGGWRESATDRSLELLRTAHACTLGVRLLPGDAPHRMPVSASRTAGQSAASRRRAGAARTGTFAWFCDLGFGIMPGATQGVAAAPGTALLRPTRAQRAVAAASHRTCDQPSAAAWR